MDDLKGSGKWGFFKQLVGLIAFARGNQKHVLQVVDASPVEEHVGKHLEESTKAEESWLLFCFGR